MSRRRRRERDAASMPQQAGFPASPRGGEEDLVVLVDESVDPRVVAYHDPQSPAAEQLRAFRTTLIANLGTADPRVITVTSAMEKEGKSLTTANLGVVLADLAETSVCLVDADLRKPGLETIFSLPEQPGLADHLVDHVELEECVSPVCLGTFDVLPAGSEPRRAIDLLGSDRFRDMLNELRDHYDFVLVDTPPTLLFSDSIVVGGASDGTLLITRLRFTPRTAIHQTVARIRQAGGTVLGAFIVGADEP